MHSEHDFIFLNFSTRRIAKFEFVDWVQWCFVFCIVKKSGDVSTGFKANGGKSVVSYYFAYVFVYFYKMFY